MEHIIDVFHPLFGVEGAAMYFDHVRTGDLEVAAAGALVALDHSKIAKCSFPGLLGRRLS